MRSFLTNAAFCLASAVLTSGIVAFSDPAVANVPNHDVAGVAVSTHDLDLHSIAGRSTAERRIRFAARSVCDGELFAPIEASQCRTQAIKDADRALQAEIAAR